MGLSIPAMWMGKQGNRGGRSGFRRRRAAGRHLIKETDRQHHAGRSVPEGKREGEGSLSILVQKPFRAEYGQPDALLIAGFAFQTVLQEQDEPLPLFVVDQ